MNTEIRFILTSFYAREDKIALSRPENFKTYMENGKVRKITVQLRIRIEWYLNI
jgi:hypothetical protein